MENALQMRQNYFLNAFRFQCEPGLGATVMYNLLYFHPYKLMLLAGCSTVCTTVAEAAKMWNLVVVNIRLGLFPRIIMTKLHFVTSIHTKTFKIFS